MNRVQYSVTGCVTPNALEILVRIHRASVALGTPECLAEALDEHVFCVVYFQALA